MPHSFPKAQASCGAGDLVAGVSGFKTKSPADGKDRQRHNAGFGRRGIPLRLSFRIAIATTHNSRAGSDLLSPLVSKFSVTVFSGVQVRKASQDHSKDRFPYIGMGCVVLAASRALRTAKADPANAAIAIRKDSRSGIPPPPTLRARCGREPFPSHKPQPRPPALQNSHALARLILNRNPDPNPRIPRGGNFANVICFL
jgi:hypothetical protein